MRNLARVMLRWTRAQIIGNADVEMLDSGSCINRKRVCLGPPSPFGLWRGSLRSLRYEGPSGLAQPKLAKRAKAGGARRDRTADLLHAMQALSQLSYGPLRLPRAMGDARGKP